jgi:hypothetical protein
MLNLRLDVTHQAEGFGVVSSPLAGG